MVEFHCVTRMIKVTMKRWTEGLTVCLQDAVHSSRTSDGCDVPIYLQLITPLPRLTLYSAYFLTSLVFQSDGPGI